MDRRFLSAALVITVAGCASHEAVELRKFPYPYRAALAICSDIDETESIEKFIEIQRFLNTTIETSFGLGLGLEVGNSFWFYNQQFELHNRRQAGDSVPDVYFSGVPDLGISLFSGTSDSLSAHAPILFALIRAGYIDCLHSYGNFGVGGFSPALAERAAELLQRESLRVDVFTNHGGRENEHNLGDALRHLGDNPTSDLYHAAFTRSLDVKFLWRGHLTHVVGQDGDCSIKNLAKLTYERLQDLFYTAQDFPHDNKLVHIMQLDDSRKVFDFVRYINPWGRYSVAREPFIPHQLGQAQIDELIASRGFMIFYTHLGVNPQPPYLHDSTIAALRYVAARNETGELLVTTTSKLLNYYVHCKYLYWQTRNQSDTLYIMIDSIANEVEGSFVPTEADLEGLTMYVPLTTPIQLLVANEPIPFVTNAKDETGRFSISVPWRPLKFPDDTDLKGVNSALGDSDSVLTSHR
ncbi:MAG TPA: hypothetical protein VN285_13710 [Candidatus Deferrimicrobium sp.]|nr:hypothetical protein [Candidatus Deferrimicrobium sp.]